MEYLASLGMSDLVRLHPEACCRRPGVMLTQEGTAFTVYAGNADVLDLCLYHPGDFTRETARVRMRRMEAGWWHAHLGENLEGWGYGYRAHGAWAPEKGFFYNSRKLLLDPWALAVAGDCRARRDMLVQPSPRRGPGRIDNGPTALKGVVTRPEFDWSGDAKPCVPWDDTVIYELHVKGFTRRHPGVPPELRGTYAGLAHPAVTSYLRALGVTSVQLLPVHQHVDDGFLVDRGLTNYWGYNSVGFLAPHAGYAAARDAAGLLAEFKGMVKAMHAAGLEVILDVVYNHTAEGNQDGPSIMFRGLDNTAFYHMLEADDRLHFWNVTGCGNAVASSNPVALRVIMDSLRYWVEEMRVDGFRFDLAVTTGRGRRAYDRNSAFFTALAQDPVVGTVKLIAEPWDVGEMDSYQVGNFPAPWRELNGRHRDTARRYWRGALGVTASFAKRLCGSQDMFAWDARPPTSSVNLLTSHDGFTLRDLVSYQSKHNLANGEDNRDGDNDNHSSNAGVEGDSDDPVVLSLRRRRARAMLAGLLVARGVPFLTAGDERWRTQLGNNNAYCQDNEISWIDWTPDPEAESLTDFTRRLLAFRRGHPVLRRAAFLGGRIDPSTGLRDVTWLTGGGGLLGHDAWHEDERRCFGMLLDDRPPLLLIFLADPDAELEFTLPGDTGSQWDLVFDSSLEAPFPDHAVTVTGAWKIQGPAVACLRLRDGKLPPVIPA